MHPHPTIFFARSCFPLLDLAFVSSVLFRLHKSISSLAPNPTRRRRSNGGLSAHMFSLLLLLFCVQLCDSIIYTRDERWREGLFRYGETSPNRARQNGYSSVAREDEQRRKKASCLAQLLLSCKTTLGSSNQQKDSLQGSLRT